MSACLCSHVHTCMRRYIIEALGNSTELQMRNIMSNTTIEGKAFLYIRASSSLRRLE